MDALVRHPYLQKVEAARRQIEFERFPTAQDAGGITWVGERYHVMYTSWFRGYFLYKITGITGALEDYGHCTWWGFDIQTAMHEEHSDEYEQPLLSIEIKAWLTLNYGQLDVSDYEYLINILWLEHTSDGRAIHYIRNHYHWHQAMDWLIEQRTRAKALGINNAANEIPQTAPTTINPWVPLLIGTLKLDGFYRYLEDCGLLAPNKKLTPLGDGTGLGKARKAPWVGALLALKKEKLLDNNMAAVSRALIAPLGEVQVKLSENSLLNPTNKSDTYQQVAEAILTQHGYLRN